MSTTKRAKNILNLVFDKASSDGEALNGINMIKTMLAKQNLTFSDIIGKTSIIEKEVSTSSDTVKKYENEIANLRKELSNKETEFSRYRYTQENIIKSKDTIINEQNDNISKLINQQKSSNISQEDIEKIKEPLENEIKNLMTKVSELSNGNPYKIHHTVEERLRNGLWNKLNDIVDKKDHEKLKMLIRHAVSEAPLGHTNEWGFSSITEGNRQELEWLSMCECDDAESDECIDMMSEDAAVEDLDAFHVELGDVSSDDDLNKAINTAMSKYSEGILKNILKKASSTSMSRGNKGDN